MRIYVAGPYKPRGNDMHDAARLVYHNTRKAILIGIELIKKGHNPYIPHLTHYIHIESDVGWPPEKWIELDNEWLDYCDALYYIAPSGGADRELERAKSQNKPIYYSLEEVPNK
jgi:hypothetical protein